MNSAAVLLALTNSKGINNVTAVNFYRQLESAHDLTTMSVAQISSLLRIKYPNLTMDDLLVAYQQIRNTIDSGISVASYFDDLYPVILREIPNPPAVLYIKGNVNLPEYTKNVAIVGTRYPTEFGTKVAYSAGKLAAEHNLNVVSGLALGCDTGGHLGCLDSGGHTIAILAHGLDKVRPKDNENLAERILESGGTLISEYPVGVGPFRWSYSLRNRIQSGLSSKVLVIETGIKGGTIHTVDYAKKQNRPVACIDHPDKFKDLEKAQGNRKLIDDKTAIPITDKQTLVDFYNTG